MRSAWQRAGTASTSWWTKSSRHATSRWGKGNQLRARRQPASHTQRSGKTYHQHQQLLLLSLQRRRQTMLTNSVQPCCARLLLRIGGRTTARQICPVCPSADRTTGRAAASRLLLLTQETRRQQQPEGEGPSLEWHEQEGQRLSGEPLRTCSVHSLPAGASSAASVCSGAC